MPIRRCERDGEQGWKGGEADSFHCYLPSEEGSEGEAKRKAILQLIAAEGPDAQIEENAAQEFAALKNVELFQPGTWAGSAGPRTYTDIEVDAMAQESNDALPYLLQHIGSDQYPENPEIDLKGKRIPALINLNHQEDLPESFIPALKATTAKFYTKTVKGIKKLFADFHGLPDDIAAFLKKKYPQRSIELMPPFYNPLTKKIQHWAIRSVGFLDPSMPPAVSGLADDFVVAFAQRNEVVTLMMTAPDEELTNDHKEKHTMARRSTKTPEEKEIQEEEQPTTPPEPAPVEDQPDQADEVKKYARQLKDLEKKVSTFESKAAEEKKQRERLETLLFAEQQARQRADIVAFKQGLLAEGVEPAIFPPGFEEFVLALPGERILKFSPADGEIQEQSPREFFKKYIHEFARRVPQGEEAAKGQAEQKTIMEMRLEKIEELKPKARQQLGDAASESAVNDRAYDLAIEKYGDNF